MEDKTLFNTRALAEFLNINEKMVYSLISDKGLPATKVTGKWLFPRQMVELWLERETINVPKGMAGPSTYPGLVVISGSNDILLDHAVSLFNRLHPEHMAVFGNLGSMGGIKALRRNLCHIAASHLLQETEDEYNFDFARQELGEFPAVVNFCRREQGLLLAKDNPKNIKTVDDLGKKGIRIVNRTPGTGTRLLLDRELEKAGLEGEKIPGYGRELGRHLDVGLEILGGRADAAPGIKAVAGLLGLDFLPLRWERFDLLVLKSRFFEREVQHFLGLLHESAFRDLIETLQGYDLSICGRVVFPQQMQTKKEKAQ
jgi:putative molybdopterin biosynthesis protein